MIHHLRILVITTSFLPLAIGCSKSPDLPSVIPVVEKYSHWVINPQSEGSKERQRAYKKDPDDVVREVEILLRDGSRARKYYDTFGKVLLSMTGELSIGSNFQASFDEAKHLTSLKVTNQAGVIGFQLETVSPQMQKMTFYRNNKKVAEVTGTNIFPEEYFQPVMFLQSQADVSSYDCQPATPSNTWSLFREDGSLEAQIEITPYNIEFGDAFHEPVYPISQRHVCTAKSLFAPEGYLYYQEKCTKVEHIKRKTLSDFKTTHECVFYFSGKKIHAQGSLTRDLIAQLRPEMGRLEHVDIYAEDGLTIVRSRDFDFLEGNIYWANKDTYSSRDLGAMGLAAFHGEEYVLSIIQYQEAYGFYLEFMKPLIERK